jgi:hypothetical protein
VDLAYENNALVRPEIRVDVSHRNFYYEILRPFYAGSVFLQVFDNR